MKFKVDENLPSEIGELLIRAGHESMSVLEQGLGGATDEELAGVCRQEGRVLVTLDLDFADIRTYPPGQHDGIIVLRVLRQDKSHVLRVFSSVVPLVAQQPLAQRLWIVEETRVRVRGD